MTRIFLFTSRNDEALRIVFGTLEVGGSVVTATVETDSSFFEGKDGKLSHVL